MSAPDTRQLALDVLLRVDRGAPSDRSLDRCLTRYRPAPRDRRLLTELVYGVLRRQRGLDATISHHSSRPLEGMDAPVRVGLRLGVYQLRHLDKVPDHAAVDRTVGAVKGWAPDGAGFVNGVLRAILRRGRELDTGTSGDRASFAAELEVPDWWGDRWRSRYGDEVAAIWFRSALEPAPVVLRAHPRVATIEAIREGLAADGVEARATEHAKRALQVVKGNPFESGTFATGALTPRGEASQLVAELLALPPGAAVLDACAGRGGKAIQIAEDFTPAVVVASDLAPWRARACLEAAHRARTPEVHPVVADLARPGPFRRDFDAVLVDAPCSGLGTVRRRPELKWRNDPERLRRLAQLQLSIVRSASGAVAPGGLLLYVTCSTEPEENEEVVDSVLEEVPDLERTPIRLPEGIDERFLGDDGYFRSYPTFPALDGFFAAALRRRR